MTPAQLDAAYVTVQTPGSALFLKCLAVTDWGHANIPQ